VKKVSRFIVLVLNLKAAPDYFRFMSSEIMKKKSRKKNLDKREDRKGKKFKGFSSDLTEIGNSLLSTFWKILLFLKFNCNCYR